MYTKKSLILEWRSEMAARSENKYLGHRTITDALAVPFRESEIKFKPQAVKGNLALALAYVDVRVIMDRLDEVLGIENWQDHYQLLPNHSVMCRLRLRIGERWITKADVGSPSEQPDSGDRLKAAFSDALKRAAVKFGIGRYLYRLPQQWVDYDPGRKQFVNRPRLPGWAMQNSAMATAAKNTLPTTGAELHQRLREADSDLAVKGLCPIGALLAHVTQAGVKAGFGADLNQWTGPAIDLAVRETRSFKSRFASAPEMKNAV
jgi:hypothetical protein